jgi:cytochrome c peroxidase
LKKVKITWGITVGFAALCMITAFNIPVQPADSHAEKVDKFYLQQLDQLKQKLEKLKFLCVKKENISLVQNQFNECRLTYKKAAILIDHFNIHDEILLNGQPISRVEEDHPDVIIQPQGFQVIEQSIFNKQFEGYDGVISEIDKMIVVLSKLETEPDRANKFGDVAVFDAMQSSLIKMMTLDVTGFDAPIDFHSIPETKAVAEGFEELFSIYKPELETKNPVLSSSLIQAVFDLEHYLMSHPDFNKFDRLIFISKYANPFYRNFVEVRKEFGFYSKGLLPINLRSKTIFSEDFFNIDFFSPGNGYGVTENRIELGKQLFNDPILSGTKNRSCASCHKPEFAFTDGLRTPMSIDNSISLPRNTPGLWNSALQTRQFFDSRVDILENQLEEVVHNTNEMNGSLKQSVRDLRNDSHYSTLFKKAYSQNKEPVVEFNIANAIASYIRSLVALNSKFDRFMRGEAALKANEKNGFNLFMGKAKCGTCHFMPLFNGLLPPQFSETESEVIGVPKTNLQPELDGDEGKYLFTRSAIDKFSFKTPTLRNIELTAPYMHNGSFANLKDVLNFYNKGGGKGLKIAPANQTLPFEKLDLTSKEMNDIISFMKTLTDTVPKPAVRLQ